ncbi:hypothetical protein PG987_006433 [Apiospora arundinis]
MDPFQNLPAELRVMILAHIRSKRIIQASPTMLRQYMESKVSIASKWLASDLDEEMVQDAMAIIHFPSPHSTSHFSSRSRYALIDWTGKKMSSSIRLPSLHIDSHFSNRDHHVLIDWVAKRLPNPLRSPFRLQDNQLIIQKLEKLHGRLLLFIEDYITKATAPYPPREYTCLPTLSQTQTWLTFQGQPVSPRFDASELTGPERTRLLKAFLRHHLISLVHQAQAWEYDQGYPEELYQYGSQKFQSFEQEALFCVRAYLKSLYGAIFAQCGDSWCPESPQDSTSPHPHGLLYPDNLYMNPNLYASDFSCQPAYRSITSKLAVFGFDLIWSLLRSTMAGRQGRDRAINWFNDTFPRSDRTGNHRAPVRWYTNIDWRDWCDLYPGKYMASHTNLNEENHEKNPGMYRILYPRVSNVFTLQKRIYRQRAWVFFDDDRFYPSSSTKAHFPTPEELDQERRGVGWLLNLEYTRAQRRSQKWHDEETLVSYDDLKRELFRDAEPEKACNATLPGIIGKAYVKAASLIRFLIEPLDPAHYKEGHHIFQHLPESRRISVGGGSLHIENNDSHSRNGLSHYVSDYSGQRFFVVGNNHEPCNRYAFRQMNQFSRPAHAQEGSSLDGEKQPTSTKKAKVTPTTTPTTPTRDDDFGDLSTTCVNPEVDYDYLHLPLTNRQLHGPGALGSSPELSSNSDSSDDRESD